MSKFNVIIQISSDLVKCLYMSCFIRKTIRIFESFAIYITHVVFYVGHIRHKDLLCAENVQMNFIWHGNWRTLWIHCLLNSEREKNADLNVEHVFINNNDNALSFAHDKPYKQTRKLRKHIQNIRSETATASHSP